MPINVQCTGCEQKFQAPDQSAGKQIKCPNCSVPIDIPHPDEQTRITGKRAAQPAALKKAQQLSPEQLKVLQQKRAARKEAIEAQLAKAPSPETEPDSRGADILEKLDQTELPEWHVQTEDGEEYGPVTKVELEEWVVDGRLDQSCQVIHEDWDQWKWAEEVFPELGEAAQAEPDSPFDQWAAIDSKAGSPVVQDVVAVASDATDAPVFAQPEKVTTAASPRTSQRTSSPTTGRQRRYPALTLTAKIYEILAWVVGAAGLLLAGLAGILLLGQDMQLKDFLAFLTAEFTILLYTFIAVITMKAFAELISLFINLEHDNQTSAEAMQRVVELLSKQK